MQETNLRMLIRIYIGERYLPHFLPPLDDSFDIDLADGSDVVHGHISPSTTMMDDHSEELSPDFKENYEKWLMENVYDSMDDENEEQKPSTSDTDYSALAPSTPIPSPYIMPVDSELSESLQKLDINDLYRDALDDELSTDASSEDGPRSPISYMTDDVNNEKQELFYGLYQKLRTVEHITVQRWHEAHGQHWCIIKTWTRSVFLRRYQATDYAIKSINDEWTYLVHSIHWMGKNGCAGSERYCIFSGLRRKVPFKPSFFAAFILSLSFLIMVDRYSSH